MFSPIYHDEINVKLLVKLPDLVQSLKGNTFTWKKSIFAATTLKFLFQISPLEHRYHVEGTILFNSCKDFLAIMQLYIHFSRSRLLIKLQQWTQWIDRVIKYYVLACYTKNS